MSLSKENKATRKLLRDLVQHAEWLGHVPYFPIKVVFKHEKQMDDCYATTELKGKGSKRYIEIAFDEEYLKTSHGRDLCKVNMIHELAHALTWSNNTRVEEARTMKYGTHGPEFGIVYAQLWEDLIEGRPEEHEDS